MEQEPPTGCIDATDEDGPLVGGSVGEVDSTIIWIHCFTDI